MLHYEGTDVYTFHNEFGHPITLTKNDVNTICDLAKENPDFNLNQEVEALAEKSEHWQELYSELIRDKEKLFNDIMSLVHNHKIEEA